MGGKHVLRMVVASALAVGVLPIGAAAPASATSYGGCTSADLRYETVDIPDAAVTQVRDLNESGQVVGRFGKSPDALRGLEPMFGFRTEIGSEVYETVAVPGVHSTYPEGINRKGVVSGFAGQYDQSGGILAPTAGFLWSLGKLGTPVVDTVKYPGIPAATFTNKVTDDGTVAGFAVDGAGAPHSYVAHGSTFTDVVVPGSNATYVNSVDGGGRIGGGVSMPNGGFSFVRTGSTDDLVTLTCGTFSLNDLNERGDLAGTVTTPDGRVHGAAVIGGVARLVDVPGASETRVYGIDGSGQVAGEYRDSTGSGPHGFVGLNPAADLELTATGPSGPVGPGTEVTETYVVTNTGPSSAVGVELRISDGDQVAPLPKGCTVVLGVQIVCTLGFLESGQVTTVAIRRSYLSTGVRTKTGTVSSSTPDPVSTNNSATVTTDVRPPGADLELTMVHGVTDPQPDEDFTETWTIRNIGPAVAHGVLLHVDTPNPYATTWTIDELPEGCSFGGYGILAPWIDCTVDPIAVGATASFTFTLSFDAGSWHRTGAVSSSITDAVMSNNTVDRTVVVQPGATYLDVIATGSPSTVLVGDPVTETYTVKNVGSGRAVDVVVRLPGPVVDPFGFFPEPGQPTMAGPATCTRSQGNRGGRTYDDFVCPLGTIEPGASASRQLTVRYASTATVSRGAVSATTATPSPLPASRFQIEYYGFTTIIRRLQADLGLTASKAPTAPVLPGQPVVETWTVTNHGPETTPDASLTVPAPTTADTTFTMTAPPGCTLSNTSSGRVYLCSLDELEVGESATRTFTLRDSVPGTRSRTGRAFASTSDDPTSSNDQATLFFVVRPRTADLSLELVQAPSSFVVVGTPTTEAYTVRNDGPEPATKVLLEVPTYDPFSSSKVTPPAGAGCALNLDFFNPNLATWRCPMGTLGVGQTASRTFAVTQAFVGSTQRVAKATAAEFDQDPADAQVNVFRTTRAAWAYIDVSAAGSPGEALVGQDVVETYTVRNHGPDPATDVVLKIPGAQIDPYTGGQSPQIVAEPPGCTVSTDLFTLRTLYTCPLGTLAAGATVTRQITVRHGVVGTVVRPSATVSSTTGYPPMAPPDGTPNSVTTVVKLPTSDLVLTATDAPDPVAVGVDTTETWTVRNDGPHAANNVQLLVPGGQWSLLGAIYTVTPPAGCSAVTLPDHPSEQWFRCSLGTLKPGQVASRSFKVRSAVAGTRSRTARVTSDSSDPNPLNSQLRITTTVK